MSGWDVGSASLLGNASRRLDRSSMRKKQHMKELVGCEQRLLVPRHPVRHPVAWMACKRFGPIAIIVGVMLVIFAMGWHHQLSLENIVALRDRFHTVLTEHRLRSLLIYFLVYVCAAALSLPGGLILTATGGLLFGWLLGGIAAVAGATVGATIIFLVAKSALGEGLTTQAAPWIAKLRAGFENHALSYLLFLRLVPAFPFWFVNIAPAILGLSLRTYVIGTFFGIIPATFAFAAAGAGLDSVIMAAKKEYMNCLARHGAEACKLTIHASSLVTRDLLLALVLLGCAALIPVAMKKWSRSHAAAK
jgi:uncharacterized membrane protein YdjX (TVP38/TMEM64 family)